MIVHSEATLSKYNKKQLIYLIRELEKELIEDKERFNDQYEVLKRFIGEHKNKLVLKIEWEKEENENN